MLKKKETEEEEKGMTSAARGILAAASEGDIQELKLLHARGGSLSCCDYDRYASFCLNLLCYLSFFSLFNFTFDIGVHHYI